MRYNVWTRATDIVGCRWHVVAELGHSKLLEDIARHKANLGNEVAGRREVPLQYLALPDGMTPDDLVVAGSVAKS